MSKALKLIKYKGIFYSPGDEIDVSKEDGERLAERGLIEYTETKVEDEDINYEDLKIADLKKLLDEEGIEYNSKATKTELIELVNNSPLRV